MPVESVMPITDKPLDETQSVVLENGLLKLVSMERGVVREILSTRDPDELLYFIYRRRVKGMAYAMITESEHGKLDMRRLGFKRMRELFLKFKNPSWQKRFDQEVEEELKVAPYNDA